MAWLPYGHRTAGDDPAMDPIRVAEIAPGEYPLCLVVGTTDVDHVIHELGHEANASLWEGIVELLVMTEAPMRFAETTGIEFDD